jgi:outer membrane protein OmpU
MNNSTRNLKMKKLLIASTALVATAGMAAADVTVTGHAAAGYHSNLVQKSTMANSLYRGEGIYSNVGVDFAMSGATDNGISFTASLNIDAGSEIDQGDYEFDGNDGGTAGLGAVTMAGDFGTLTFDDNGIGNLFDGDYSNHDISYATTVNGVAITVAADADESVADAGAAGTDDASAKAVLTSGDMTYTLTASNHSTAGMSTKVAVAFAVNDMLSVNANSKSLSAAGAKTVAGVGATIVANGLTVTVASDNAQPTSGWDLDLAYSLGGVALAYGTDEGSSHDLTATYALGGGATFKAGMKNHGTSTAAKAALKDSVYAGVSFAF